MSTRGTRRMLIVTTVVQTIQGFLLPFAEHLRAHGWEVEAATGAESASEITGAFDRVHPIHWDRRIAAAGNLRALGEIRRVMARGRFDVVHVHTPIASFVTRLAAGSRGAQRPAIVYTAHGFHFYEGGDPQRNRAYRAAERLAGRWTDREIVINTEDYQAALDAHIVPADRVRLFPGIGVDLDHYAPTPEMHAAADRLRLELGIDPQVTVYSMAAEFIPRKNHRAAVAALARLEDRGAQLLLAGQGAILDQIRQQVTELGLADRVHFLGAVQDIRPVFLCSDASVLPSYQEGLSRAVLESLAIGVPVVGARTRGIRDLVDDDLGIVVGPDDVAGLTRALTDVLTFPTHGALRERSLKRLERNSLAHVIDLHDQLYDELLGERAAARR